MGLGAELASLQEMGSPKQGRMPPQPAGPACLASDKGLGPTLSPLEGAGGEQAPLSPLGRAYTPVLPPDPSPQESVPLGPWPCPGNLPADHGPPQPCPHPFTGPRLPPQEATWGTEETEPLGRPWPCDPMELRRPPEATPHP